MHRLRSFTCCRAFALATSVNVFQPPLLESQEAAAIARNAFPSVALVAVADKGGQPLAIGSGFVIDRELVVTNRHVVAGGHSAIVKLVGTNTKYDVANVTAVDDKHDLVILRVPNLTAPRIAFLAGPLPEIGSRIYAIGNPRGLEGTFSDGIVSGLRTLGPDSVIQITAPISPGSSGGPVLNASGELIGVAVASMEEGQNLNFAIPSQYVDRLARVSGPPRPLSSVPRAATGPARWSTPGASPGVVLGAFRWSSDAGYSLGMECDSRCVFTFSIRNNLNRGVRKVQFVIVFYDRAGEPLDTYEWTTWKTQIGPGLAARESGSVDTSVRRLTVRMAFRVLNYEFVD